MLCERNGPIRAPFTTACSLEVDEVWNSCRFKQIFKCLKLSIFNSLYKLQRHWIASSQRDIYVSMYAAFLRLWIAEIVETLTNLSWKIIMKIVSKSAWSGNWIIQNELKFFLVSKRSIKRYRKRFDRKHADPSNLDWQSLD